MDDRSYRHWLNQRTGETCVENLKRHRFDAHWFENCEQARSYILDAVDGYQTFGLGGSDTTRKMGLIDALQQRGKTIFDHLADGFDLEKSSACRREQLGCDCFLCSANAVSKTGEIVNVDGVGNRTSAMGFGPQKVIVIAGINKVRPDLESAMRRIREIAGPMRAKSLNMDTPCAVSGVCSDCNSPQRICNITTILHRKPMLTDVAVVLINEVLGY